MPQMGVSVAEGTVVAWRVEVGDPIEADADDLRDLDRQDRHRGPGAGRRRRRRDPGAGRGDGRGRGGAGADRGGRDAAAAPAGATPDAGHAGDAGRRSRQPTRRTGAPRTGAGASTAARRPAAAAATPRSSSGSPPSTGSTSRQVPGTGRGGRVRKQDVLAFVESAARRREPPLHIESPYRPDPSRRRARRRRRPALADAPPDRRAHEALARDRRHLHDLDRGRHDPGRGGARAARRDRAAVRRARDDRGAARAPGARTPGSRASATRATRTSTSGSRSRSARTG